MSGDNQTQRAGHNSSQVQFGDNASIIVGGGISEQRAREIMGEYSRTLVAEYTHEALSLVRERVAVLDDRVATFFNEQDKLSSFADPGFLRTYKKAQAGAATSERESDYEMLTGLLSQRADSPARKTRAGVDRAIEIVDQLDDDALRGLTVMQAIFTWEPSSGLVETGISTMAGIFRSILETGPLPLGGDWIDHLDILDAVRPSSSAQFRPFDEYYLERFEGYLSAGVATTSIELSTVEAPPWRLIVESLLVDHALKDAHSRIAALHSASLEKHLRQVGLNDENTAKALEYANDRFNFATVDESLKPILASRLRENPDIRTVAEWWDQFPSHFKITSVGKCLAIANALRLDTAGRLPRE